MTERLRVFRQAVVFCAAELRTVYTWRTWVFGWLLRLLTQVMFFALIGRLVGLSATEQFILVGNIAVLPCLEASIVIMSVTGERMSGTLPLLVIAPSSHVPVYLGRGLQWVATGCTSSLVTLFVVPPVLGVPLPWPRTLLVLPLIVVIGLSSYCYSCCLASLAIRRIGLEWILLNLSYLVVMTFGGVNVPTTFWPAGIQDVVGFLPVTHGLRAIRAVLDGQSWRTVLPSVGFEILVGLGWLALAVLSFDRIVARGRADGSLELTG